MEEKKSFFASLTPVSALVVGITAGILVICTIGFVFLAVKMLKTDVNGAAKTTETQQAAVAQNTNTQQPAQQQVVLANKTNRPKIELFVMAYCPYGLQMEKAYLPVWELLKNKADFSIKFVSYAMHGLKELEENTRQYCVQKEQPQKFTSYLKCFVGNGDYAACLKTAGVDSSKLNTCVDKTNSQYKILDKYNDKSTWLSGNYPVYPIDADLNGKYGVQGSPTLIINGAEAQANRSPESVKQAVCASFNTVPTECSQALSTGASVAGFGVGADTNASSGAACGN